MTTTPTGSPLSRRRAETRERLLEAAIAVFARIGVDQARVEDISEEAGFTRGAFYSNFADKDTLIIELLQHQQEMATRVVQTSIGQVLAGPRPDDFAELVNAALDAFAENIPADNWMLAELSLRLAAMRNPLIAEHLDVFEQRQRAVLADILKTGLAEIGMRSVLPIDHLVMIALAVHGDFMVRERISSAPTTVTPEERQVLVSLLERCLEPVD